MNFAYSFLLKDLPELLLQPHSRRGPSYCYSLLLFLFFLPLEYRSILLNWREEQPGVLGFLVGAEQPGFLIEAGQPACLVEAIQPAFVIGEGQPGLEDRLLKGICLATL